VRLHGVAFAGGRVGGRCGPVEVASAQQASRSIGWSARTRSAGRGRRRLPDVVCAAEPLHRIGDDEHDLVLGLRASDGRAAAIVSRMSRRSGSVRACERALTHLLVETHHVHDSHVLARRVDGREQDQLGQLHDLGAGDGRAESAEATRTQQEERNVSSPLAAAPHGCDVDEGQILGLDQLVDVKE
jgi:hypothetical protein